MKNKHQIEISRFTDIRSNIEKASGYFEGTLKTMPKVSSKAKQKELAEHLQEELAIFQQAELAIFQQAELAKFRPKQLAEFEQRELTESEKEELAKSQQKELAIFCPEQLAEFEQKELAEFTELFSEVSILWQEKLATVLKILNPEKITVVPEELSNKIVGSLCKVTQKVRDVDDYVKFYVKTPDLHKTDWLTKLPLMFDKMIKDSGELLYINEMTASAMTASAMTGEPEEVAGRIHQLLKESSSPELKAIKAKFAKSEKAHYKDIKISEETCWSLYQLLYEAKNHDSDIIVLAEHVRCELNASLSASRKVTSWVSSKFIGGAKHSLELLHHDNSDHHPSVLGEANSGIGDHE